MKIKLSVLLSAISFSPSLALAQGAAAGKDNSTLAGLLWTLGPFVILALAALIFRRMRRGRAPKKRYEHNAMPMIRHAPAVFFILAAVTAVSAIWLHSPVTYIVASIAVGAAYLMLLVCAWRLRSTVATIACAVIIMVVHERLRAWLVPHDDFTVIQGLLVSVSLVFLLMWLLRGWLSRACRFTDETHAA